MTVPFVPFRSIPGFSTTLPARGKATPTYAAHKA